MLNGKMELHNEGHKYTVHQYEAFKDVDDCFTFEGLTEARKNAIHKGFYIGAKVKRVKEIPSFNEGVVKCLAFTKKEGWFGDGYTPIVVYWTVIGGTGYEMSYAPEDLILLTNK